MRIDIRGLVKELLENKNLIVNYNELNDGGFDLSVRINEEAVNSMPKEKSNYDINSTGLSISKKEQKENESMEM